MIKEQLKVTAVSYLNTKPFLYGLLNSPLIDFLDVQLATPAESAAKLLRNEADIGLIPVAVLPELNEYHIVSDYCIGAINEVGTVGIFSERPIEEIEEIYLDYHSRTSVRLVQILMKEYWKKDVKFLESKPGFIADIRGSRAGVVIGDRAIGLHSKFPYHYDMATAWYQLTGLPFVFAVWVSKRPLDPFIKGIFDKALRDGLQKIEHLIKILPSPAEDFSLKKYFTQQISYTLDESKKMGMHSFLNRLHSLDREQAELQTLAHK